jgi:hypothetical protein
MSRNRDPLALTPHWHVDCRIVLDLPEDTVVGRRFSINLAYTAAAVAVLLLAGYYGFVALNLSREINDWEQRISENRAEVSDIQRMQREYSAEAIKIDQAFALVRPQLFVSEFVANLGRTRPERMGIDIIEWNDAGVVVRGSLQGERSDRATELLGGYVDQLRRDPQIGPLFREIGLTDLDRGTSGETLRFEIKFSLKNS